MRASLEVTPKPLLLLSNGHGEDLSGSLIGQALGAQGQRVMALPLVGHGRAYLQAGIEVLGRTRECSTGGLGYTSFGAQLREIREGQWAYLLGRLLWLRRHRSQFGLVIAVGDLLPVLGLWLSGLPGAVYLVAYSSHYEGRLRLPWPCGWLLRSKRILEIWSRDQLTALDLSSQLGRCVRFLGNPFMDGLPTLASDPSPEPRPPARQTLALLPGSRMPEALQNLLLMLRVLERLPSELQQPGRLRLRVALVSAMDQQQLAARAGRLGWQLEQPAGEGTPLLRRGSLRLELGWGSFGTILQDSDLVLASAGTASEQAVGLAKPVLQLCGPGPQFTASFAEAQRRLLGPGVCCAIGPSGDPGTLEATAELASQLLARQWADGGDWRQGLERIGAERIGPIGGSEAMAAAIMALVPITR
ncbi:lipid-A-disaccharide synthase-related protein [Cyanobium sp. WAJ14-Wanaka]|uniref:lipid-A-disaccharide synthase-related protein n=1 Tax=Cyanobium sp. WAJ14-Wanaka TaxID=2823725 RepID=UPI0020CE75C9|nr:lipid-A-disaccharide synthase-related protein [Cyanobium sp. WAJ14-Wanaka]MCP9775305.1 lipid-A-disaccharide synthase-related protein [Cyanobium sp. WAJ14-Wanaka]